ncbi:hypothetical protein [Streptomyces albogriseolus]
MSTFAGLLTFAAFGWTWIDPVAGFVIAACASWRQGSPGRRTRLRRRL